MYQLASPHPDLQTYISHYWRVKALPDQPLALSVDAYADARADLIFNFGAPYTRQVLGQKSKGALDYRHSNFDAQRTEPIQIVQSGAVAVVGVRFQTGGVAPFVKQSLEPFTNHTPAPARLWGPAVLQLEAALKACLDDLQGCQRLLDQFFLQQLALTPEVERFWQLKTQLEQAETGMSINSFCQQQGLSQRSLARLFANHLGISPKRFARILRFQKALQLLMLPELQSLVAVAQACAYFDQSHLVRDFKSFAGGLPHQYKGYFPEHVPRDFAPNLVQFVQDKPATQG